VGTGRAGLQRWMGEGGLIVPHGPGGCVSRKGMAYRWGEDGARPDSADMRGRGWVWRCGQVVERRDPLLKASGVRRWRAQRTQMMGVAGGVVRSIVGGGVPRRGGGCRQSRSGTLWRLYHYLCNAAVFPRYQLLREARTRKAAAELDTGVVFTECSIPGSHVDPAYGLVSTSRRTRER